MEDQIVSFGIAQLAHEKGFKEKCFYQYNCHTKKHYFNSYFVEENNEQSYSVGENNLKINKLHGDNWILAPTQTLLQKWLREKYDLHIKIDPTIGYDEMGKDVIRYTYSVVRNVIENDQLEFELLIHSDFVCDTYEYALDSALMAILKFIEL